MNEINFTAPRTVHEFWELTAHLPYETAELRPASTTETRHLSRVEKLSLEIHLPERVPARNGVLYEALARLFVMAKRSPETVSGPNAAVFLQDLFGYSHPSSTNAKGWEILLRLDASDLGLKAFVTTPNDSGSGCERLRLAERVNQIGTCIVNHGRS